MITNLLGTFYGRVLLSENRWDRQQVLNDLKDEWGIEYPCLHYLDNYHFVMKGKGDELIIIGKSSIPLSKRTSIKKARSYGGWEGAEDAARNHKAYISVLVTGFDNGVTLSDEDVVKRAILFTEILASCSRQKGALAVTTNYVFREPDIYYETALMLKKDCVPIENWVRFDYKLTQTGLSIVSRGLRLFGKNDLKMSRDDATNIVSLEDDFEIVSSYEDDSDLDILVNSFAYYVVHKFMKNVDFNKVNIYHHSPYLLN